MKDCLPTTNLTTNPRAFVRIGDLISEPESGVRVDLPAPIVNSFETKPMDKDGNL